MSTPHGEHGTERTYIIGFLLSLIFTIIPYNLVVNHASSSTILLATVLGIAVIQMVIQVVFFLHLGRERKPRWQLYFFGGTIIGIMTVVGGSIFIMAHLHHNMNPVQVTAKLTQDEGISQIEGTKTNVCQTTHAERTIAIHGGIASPSHVDASTCDALLFSTDDSTSYTVVFETNSAQVPYAGVDKLPVAKNHGNMLILSVPGSYEFTDRQKPSVTGSFTVTK